MLARSATSAPWHATDGSRGPRAPTTRAASPSRAPAGVPRGAAGCVWCRRLTRPAGASPTGCRDGSPSVTP